MLNLAVKVVSPSSKDFTCKLYLIKTTSNTNMIKIKDRQVFDISSPSFNLSIANHVKCIRMLQIWYQIEPLVIVFLFVYRFLLGKVIYNVNARPEEEVESNGN